MNSGLDAVNMAVVDPGEMAQQSRPGDVLVLSPYDSPPSDAALLFSESVTVTRHTAQAGAPSSDVVVLARAYRR